MTLYFGAHITADEQQFLNQNHKQIAALAKQALQKTKKQPDQRGSILSTGKLPEYDALNPYRPHQLIKDEQQKYALIHQDGKVYLIDLDEAHKIAEGGNVSVVPAFELKFHDRQLCGAIKKVGKIAKMSHEMNPDIYDDMLQASESGQRTLGTTQPVMIGTYAVQIEDYLPGEHPVKETENNVESHPKIARSAPTVKLRIAYDIFYKLDHIHHNKSRERGGDRVHLDISPDNTLIRFVGEDYLFSEIIDRGGSKPVGDQITMPVGKRLYMAPEIALATIHNPYTLTNKEDIFSMAPVIYKILGGVGNPLSDRQALFADGNKVTFEQMAETPFNFDKIELFDEDSWVLSTLTAEIMNDLVLQFCQRMQNPDPSQRPTAEEAKLFIELVSRIDLLNQNRANCHSESAELVQLLSFFAEKENELYSQLSKLMVKPKTVTVNLDTSHQQDSLAAAPQQSQINHQQGSEHNHMDDTQQHPIEYTPSVKSSTQPILQATSPAASSTNTQSDTCIFKLLNTIVDELFDILSSVREVIESNVTNTVKSIPFSTVGMFASSMPRCGDEADTMLTGGFSPPSLVSPCA